MTTDHFTGDHHTVAFSGTIINQLYFDVIVYLQRAPYAADQYVTILRLFHWLLFPIYRRHYRDF